MLSLGPRPVGGCRRADGGAKGEGIEEFVEKHRRTTARHRGDGNARGAPGPQPPRRGPRAGGGPAAAPARGAGREGPGVGGPLGKRGAAPTDPAAAARSVEKSGGSKSPALLQGPATQSKGDGAAFGKPPTGGTITRVRRPSRARREPPTIVRTGRRRSIAQRETRRFTLAVVRIPFHRPPRKGSGDGATLRTPAVGNRALSHNKSPIWAVAAFGRLPWPGSAGSWRREVAGQRDQQPDPEAGRAVADVLAADVPGGPGDVQVGPGLAVDELLQERGRVDRARLALRRRVGEVGVRAPGQLLVLGVERAGARPARRFRSAARKHALAHASSLEISPA